ncbi:MAG TPA: hypothetical protein VLA93_22685 [Pyrinomonadaceae bacterium]|nr:hypothetical protein [Pyrinomonadaceae bacterium]
MRRMITSHFGEFLLVTVLFTPVCVNAQGTPPESTVGPGRVNLTLPNPNPFTEILPADFCEVIQNAHRYDGKIIRVRGILSQHFEGSSLSQPNDSQPCYGMRVVRACKDDECKQLAKRLHELRGGQLMSRSDVLVVGRFKYRRLLTAGDVRRGLSRYELQISKVEEIYRLPDKPNH